MMPHWIGHLANIYPTCLSPCYFYALDGPTESNTLIIIELCGIPDHDHELDDAYHPPYAGFYNQQAMPESREMFVSTLLMPRKVGHASTERYRLK